MDTLKSAKIRAAFLILVFLHGVIHLLGFVKGFDIKEVRALTLPISKPIGIGWLLATVFTLTFGVFYFANNRYTWLIGFLSVFISQTLIILYWQDARFGTIPNIIILIVSLASFGFYNFQRTVQQETEQLISPSKPLNEKVISESDLSDLPEPVQNWLRHSGVIGKEYIRVGKVRQKAEMKLKPDQQDWMKATALQYTTIDTPAFIWTVDVKMKSFLNFQGRDKFEDGKGEMLIKLNSLLPIVNERGEKLNEGSLQRYLGEMVWFPSLALSPFVTWQQIDDTTAIATMHYKGTKGSGTFYFNAGGDFVKFSALRFKDNDENAKRYEWVLLVNDYKRFEGIKVPSDMTATWKLDEGDWTWLKLEIEDIKYNENAFRY